MRGGRHQRTSFHPALAPADGFTKVDFDRLNFPAQYKIDYVRVYQDAEAVNVGCSPPDYPTAQYLACNRDTYIMTKEDDVLIPDVCEKLPYCKSQVGGGPTRGAQRSLRAERTLRPQCSRSCKAAHLRSRPAGAHHAAPSAAPPAPQVNVEFQGGDLLGTDGQPVQYANVTTSQECCQLCAKNPACGAWVWNPRYDRVCIFKVRAGSEGARGSRRGAPREEWRVLKLAAWPGCQSTRVLRRCRS